MIRFRRRKTRKQTLNELLDTLARMEQSLAEIKRDGVRGHVDITVENLKVDQANLERLVFHLESLDIQDLSGALNLGNNFGVKVGSDETAKSRPQTPPTEQESSHRGSQGVSWGSPMMRSEFLSTSPSIPKRWDTNSSAPSAENSDFLTGTETGYRITLNKDKAD